MIHMTGYEHAGSLLVALDAETIEDHLLYRIPQNILDESTNIEALIVRVWINLEGTIREKAKPEIVVFLGHLFVPEGTEVDYTELNARLSRIAGDVDIKPLAERALAMEKQE